MYQLLCLRRRHDCCNPPGQPEELEDDSQHSEMDYDDFVGEESD